MTGSSLQPHFSVHRQGRCNTFDWELAPSVFLLIGGPVTEVVLFQVSGVESKLQLAQEGFVGEMTLPACLLQLTVNKAQVHRLACAGNLHLGVGYDTGVQNAFATLTGNNTVNGKEVVASGTWFQRGNQVRTEAVLKIDGRSSLWGV